MLGVRCGSSRKTYRMHLRRRPAMGLTGDFVRSTATHRKGSVRGQAPDRKPDMPSACFCFLTHHAKSVSRVHSRILLIQLADPCDEQPVDTADARAAFSLRGRLVQHRHGADISARGRKSYGVRGHLGWRSTFCSCRFWFCSCRCWCRNIIPLSVLR